jgi:hypothetical protein
MFGGSHSDPKVPLTTGSWGTIPSSAPPVTASSGFGVFGTSVPVSSAFGGSKFCPPSNYTQAPLFGNLTTEPFPSSGTFFTPGMKFLAISVYQPPGLDNFTYSGETDVGTFLRKFRDLAARHNWKKVNAMLNSIQYHFVDAALCFYNAFVQSEAFSRGKDIDVAILYWDLFVRDIRDPFGESTTYAELVRHARLLRYEQSESGLEYYFKMLELLGKMKVQNDKEIVMYLLISPHELVKAITLSNINKPDQIRQYLVRYEQLDSLFAQTEQSDEVELTSDIQTDILLLRTLQRKQWRRVVQMFRAGIIQMKIQIATYLNNLIPPLTQQKLVLVHMNTDKRCTL